MIFDSDPGMHPAKPPASPPPYMPTWGPEIPNTGPYGPAGKLPSLYNASDESTYHLAAILADLRPELIRDTAPEPSNAGPFTEPSVWYFRFGTKLVNVGVLLTPYLSSPSDPIGAIRALLASGNIPPKPAADDGGNPPHGH